MVFVPLSGLMPVRWLGEGARSFLVSTMVMVAAVAVPGPRAAWAQEYQVDLDADNVVRFISHAPIDDFEGITDRIDGFILLGDGGLAAGVAEGAEFYLEVDLASLDTGIGLRNRHMRDNYLETGRFPYATFGGVFVEVGEGNSGSFQVTAEGDLSIHGVSREVEVGCAVSPFGRGYRVRCAFELLLSDFDIEIPKVMFMKLANEIRLDLDFFVAPAQLEGGRP